MERHRTAERGTARFLSSGLSSGLLSRPWLVSLLCALPLVAALSALGLAQEPAPTEVVEVVVEAVDEPAAIDPGHTAWMLVSTALVLLMIPGLAFFYAGMVRTKNVLGTIMHSMFAMGFITIVWVVVGYSLAFGGDVGGGIVGNLDYLFLKGVRHDEAASGGNYPHIVFMAFQMMFAIITPALITGAFAERVKFRAYVAFTVLWSVLVYSPLCHWVWGGGLLSGVEGSMMSRITGVGALDFAGGTVVHISSGVSALVFVLLIGKRRAYPSPQMKPHSLVLTMLGAGLLWFGWFGFNGGSALASNDSAGLAFVVTHICAASAAVSWAVVERLHQGKASALGVASGLVAGLVCITPAAGFVMPMPALIMGLLVSPVCYYFVVVLKTKIGYDDSLDAFGIHGIGGTVGALFTGLFVHASLNGDLAGGFNKQLAAQAIAVVVTWVFAGVMTFIIVKAIDATIGIRVSEQEEEEGLDVSQHGEVGYIL